MHASTPGEESTIAERLDFAIQRSIKSGLFSSQNAVERALMEKHPDKWRNPFLSRYKTGGRGGHSVDVQAMQYIADVLGLSFEWLVIGRGSMMKVVVDAPKSEPLRRSTVPRAR